MPNFCSINPEEHFEKKMLEGRIFPLSSSDSQRKTLGSCPKNFWLPFVNWKLHIPGIKFYHISWCSMTRFVNFRLFWQRFFGEFVEIAFFDRWGSFWKKKIFRAHKCFLKNFGFRAKKSLDFWHTKSAGMTKLRSVSSKEHFEENSVVQKKSSFVFFKFWATNAGTLPKKLLVAVSKLKITYPGD